MQNSSDASKPVVFGVLLAGGESSRMGSDKCSVYFDGQTLLERMEGVFEQYAQEYKLEDVLISGSVEGRKCIPDIHHSLGPVGGLCSICKHIRKEHVSSNPYLIVLPIDMPNVTPAMLAMLMSSVSDEAMAAHFLGYELPCVLRLEQRLFQIIEETLSVQQNSNRSLRGLFKRIREVQERAVKTIEPVDPDCFLNVNRPADLFGSVSKGV